MIIGVPFLGGMTTEIASLQIICEQGTRSNQEDCFFPAADMPCGSVFLLCDGMGGHERGEVASQTVCSVLPAYLQDHWSGGVLTDDLLMEALDAAYDRLDALDDEALRKMGTTMVFLALHQGGATVAHIGDSRIYHVRPSERRILYKSRDHSLVYDLFEAGEISRSEMKRHPRRNVITRALMPGKSFRSKPDIAHVTDICTGDYFYLCSDGMLEQMSDAELVGLLSSRKTDEEKRDLLVAATARNDDNHTALLLRVGQVTCSSSEDAYTNDEATARGNALMLDGEQAVFPKRRFNWLPWRK